MPQTNRTPDFGALFYTAKRMICHFYFPPDWCWLFPHSPLFNPPGHETDVIPAKDYPSNLSVQFSHAGASCVRMKMNKLLEL
jgi:hypothetical protein